MSALSAPDFRCGAPTTGVPNPTLDSATKPARGAEPFNQDAATSRGDAKAALQPMEWRVESHPCITLALPARHLDLPKTGNSVESMGRLRLRGWVLPSGSGTRRIVVRSARGLASYEFNERRADVIRRKLDLNPDRFNGANVGFDIELECDSPLIEVGIDWGTVVAWAWSLSKIKPLQVAKVQEGRSGWLFLDKDGNHSVEQYTGRLLMKTQVCAAWNDYFEAVDRHARLQKFDWVFLLVPAKELIYPDFYPHTAGTRTPVDQLLADVDHKGRLLWPRRELERCRELAYWKGDTHWTDFGAAKGAELILLRLGLDARSVTAGVKFSAVDRAGDLGGKYTPKRTFSVMDADLTEATRCLVFDNGIQNHGRIRVYESPRALARRTCMVFGDSYSVRMVLWLVPFFSRLVYVHSAGAIDADLIAAESPATVILQSNSRFILSPLSTPFSVVPAIRDKLNSMAASDLSTLTMSLKSQSTSSTSYLQRLMLRLVEGAGAVGEVSRD